MTTPIGRQRDTLRLASAGQFIPLRTGADEFARDLFFGYEQDQTFVQGSTAYLLRDKFTTAQNPLVDGNASEGGGIGYRDVTGTGFYAASGRLRGGNTSSGQITYRPAIGDRGWYRTGGRTFCAIVSPDDGDGDVSLWLSQTSGQLNGYGVRVKNKTFEIIEPDGNVVTALVVDGAPGKAIQYLVGITLNDIKGAVYWVSAIDDYTPSGEWIIPKYPSARTLFVSLLGEFTSVYPTIYASTGFSYPGGVAIEDVRLFDVPGWTNKDSFALVADRFDRPDSSSTLGGSWVTQAGSTWGISNNKAYSSGAAFNGRAYLETGQSNVFVAAEVTSGSNLGDWFGLDLRDNGSNSFIRLYNNGSANIYGQGFSSNAYQDQVFATYAAFTTSQTKRWLAAVNGNEYRVWLNGDETVQQPTLYPYTTHQNNTKFGLFGDSASGQRWDYFAVYPMTFTLPAAFQDGAIPSEPFVIAFSPLNDLFTAANGTSLTSYNAAWSVEAGTWTIQGNKLQAATPGTDLIAYKNTYADVQASVDITLGATPTQVRAGLVLRRVDASNQIRVRLLRDDVNQLNNHEIEVIEVIGGTANIVHKCYLGNYFAANGTYNLTVVVLGDELFVYLDGVMQLYVIISNPGALNGTYAGVYREGTSENSLFDNFAIGNSYNGPTVNAIYGIATATGLTASVTVASNPTVNAAIGAATATGLTASITSHSRVAANLGVGTATGLTASITSHSLVNANIGVGTATGLQAGITSHSLVNAALGIGTATGLQASITSHSLVNANIGIGTATGLTSSITSHSLVNAALGVATTAGLTASPSAGGAPQTVNAALGVATGTGLQATIVPGAVTVSAALGVGTATGLQSTVIPGAVTISASLGLSSATGLQATIVPGAVTISSSLGATSAIGLSATVVSHSRVDSSLGSAAAIGLTASITSGSSPQTVNAALGVGTSVGLTASISSDSRVQVSLGSITISGQQAVIHRVVNANLGTSVASGLPATISSHSRVGANLGSISIIGNTATPVGGPVSIPASQGLVSAIGLNSSVYLGDNPNVYVKINTLRRRME